MRNKIGVYRNYKPENIFICECGMYCTESLYEWMMEQNKKSSSLAITFKGLILKYCRSSFRRFLEEELYKANDFRYEIKCTDDKIQLVPSKQLVFLPYEWRCDGRKPIRVNHMVLRYSLLKTGHKMPGLGQEHLFINDMEPKYIIDELVYQGREDTISGRDINAEDRYRVSEFSRAEEAGFIDNMMPFSGGPSCPDRLMSQLNYLRNLQELTIQSGKIMKDMGLNSAHPELYMASMTAAIINAANTKPEDADIITDGISTQSIIAKTNEIYKEYLENTIDNIKESCGCIETFLRYRVHASII